IMSGRAKNATGSKSIELIHPLLVAFGVELFVNPVTGATGIVGNGVPGVQLRLRDDTSCNKFWYAATSVASASGSIAPSSTSGYVIVNCTRYGSCARKDVRFVAKSRQN